MRTNYNSQKPEPVAPAAEPLIPAKEPKFYSIADLAERWRCGESSVRRTLVAENAKVFDMAEPGQRGKKLVPAAVVRKVEAKRTKAIG